MSDSAALVLLPGSERAAIPGAVPAGAVDPAERIELTLVLRRRADLPDEFVTGPATLTSAELAAGYGAADSDVDLVRSVLAERGVEVVSVRPGAGSVAVAGPAEAVCAAFGTTLSRVASTVPGGRVEHRHREGRLSVPAELDGVVTAVLGLDDRPQARSYLRRAAEPAARRSYTPPQLGSVYRFPADTDGTGQVIAILELGGGYTEDDLSGYFRSLGVPAPRVTAVGVDGGANQPGQQPDADTEVLLDIEVAGALAPGADIVVYFAPNTDRGFLDALNAAVHATPTPTAVSISWGLSEDSWTAQARTAMDRAMADAAALGVTVCVAAGDWGSADGQQDGEPHVDFPAASPNALACGGTTLNADPETGAVHSEVVWSSPDGSATGGGVSRVFPLPSWQSGVDVPERPGGGTGRGVPDLAAVADPATGYQVLVDGRPTVVGGTSAVAPLVAALTCRLAQRLGHRLGLLQPALYGRARAGHATPGFRDIRSGSNGAYSARAGWDPCTGLGAALGEDLLDRLRGGAVHGRGSTGHGTRGNDPGDEAGPEPTPPATPAVS
ncbi:S53 family peptidase [Gandjariella thermophila]|uniref:Kumamolisin n=1 Tax=Gandjariella thermophila TaxID=1931992 RepID=A0A4D4J690_9PSEU|nr:S53 family peptidase [Gandjariella thermophila]GDY32235.1 kumamolisin [Gandjariella thermophila]